MKNRPQWLACLLSLGGVLEAVAGLGLLVDPAGAASVLLQSSLDLAGVVMARIGGGGLLSLGIACWCARKTPLATASLGVSWGFFAYNAVTCLTLAWAASAVASGGLLTVAASLLHGVLGAALLRALLRAE